MSEVFEVEYDVEDNWITCPFNLDGFCEILQKNCFTLSHRMIPEECPVKKGVIVRFKK